MEKEKQQRFLVNRENSDVFCHTERLAEAFPKFEEVWAKDAAEAKLKQAMPDPAKLSLEQLEDMSKSDLLIFARKKMSPPVAVDEAMTKDELRDAIKEALFTRKPEGSA